MTYTNVLAGADTTAGQLSALLHHLLQNPQKLETLLEEIDEHEADGRLSRPVSFKEAQEMPYLQSVINESLRLYSTAGLPFWRVVPQGGAEIAGRFFPAGTEVGLNAWVVHRNESVFPDANTFKPERWLNAGEEGGEDLKRMEQYYMPVSANRLSVDNETDSAVAQFGLGSRTCLGRSIATLEMAKIIPELLRAYEFRLAPDERWETRNFWFCLPTEMSIQLKRRKSMKFEEK